MSDKQCKNFPTIKLYNSATKQLENFHPIDPENVRIYVCGPTVYDKPHIGNARPAVVFDVLFRFFQQHYQQVTYVSNITDIDDKIINKAIADDVTIDEVTTKAFADYQRDMTALNILEPTHRPRATEYVEQMKVVIKDLIKKGHAYVAENNDVLFKVDSFKDYGKFMNTQQVESDCADFALWKNIPQEDLAKALELKFCWPADNWDSEQGSNQSGQSDHFGRPGWHLECTAMSVALCGERFDIHGGGLDLKFPHHENERAQTCCVTGLDDCANYWMHNGLLEFSGGKMSKSVGNLVFLDEVIERYSALAVRLFLLQTHYRSPLNWNENGLQLAANRLLGYMKKLKDLDIDHQVCEAPAEILSALSADLNTHQALVVVDEYIAKGELAKAYKGLDVLGLIPAQGVKAWLQRKPLTEEQKRLLESRAHARQNKNFKLSDEIRDELAKAGIGLEDVQHGTTWFVL